MTTTSHFSNIKTKPQPPTFIHQMASSFNCLRFKMTRQPHRIISAADDNDNIHDISNVVGSSNGGDNNNNVRRFSWGEIEKMSKNFSKVIGSGGYSTVYLGRLLRGSGSDSGFCAIKVYGSSERLWRVYKQELDILLQLQHENIVKLLGYCDHQEEGILVFEYISNGDLQEKLHGTSGKKAPLPLSWKNRMSIAFQLAKAIAYLHEKCIIHGDIKSSNILLDKSLKCIKLCDFGSSKMESSPPSSASSSKQMLMMGSLGYMDPHYMKTGIASTKNDIYSFGVVLLELITGKEAFCSKTNQLLTTILTPQLKKNGECGGANVAEMVDPRLDGDFDVEKVKAMATMAARCLRRSPSLRPSSNEILRTMEKEISSISLNFSSDEGSI